MRRRLHRLLTVLLLTLLPWQGFAGASMLSCVHAAVPAASTVGEPCHAAATQDHAGAADKALPDPGGWASCSGCPQCHACSASVLPMAALDAPVPFPLRPAFAPPAAIAGIVLEHLDPPPVG